MPNSQITITNELKDEYAARKESIIASINNNPNSYFNISYDPVLDEIFGNIQYNIDVIQAASKGFTARLNAATDENTKGFIKKKLASLNRALNTSLNMVRVDDEKARRIERMHQDPDGFFETALAEEAKKDPDIIEAAIEGYSKKETAGRLSLYEETRIRRQISKLNKMRDEIKTADIETEVVASASKK